MGKQGPCGHCGIATTPLWRNGPPEKPVLCNACGSRWRTKGTLLSYMPMHSGGFSSFVSPEGTASHRGKRYNHKMFSEPRSHKRKEPCGGHLERGSARSHLPFFKSATDDSTSISSMSSDVIGSDDGAFYTSPLVRSNSAASSSPWEGHVPSKKRTSMVRACTSVDKLIRQFQELLSDGPAGSSTLTSSESAEDILVESKPSIMADEIGLGSILIWQTTPVQEHKGENHLLSLQSSVDPEFLDAVSQGSEARRSGGPLTQIPNGVENFSLVRGKEKAKQVTKIEDGGCMHSDRHVTPNKALLENFPYNKRDVLQSCQSPLGFLELKDIVNFDTFTGLLTDQEQGHLMQFLASEDIAKASESLKEMFTTAQFEGSLAKFQQLLSEGMFDSSDLGINPRLRQHFQQLLSLTDLTGSGWMERCSQIQNRNRRRSGSADFTKTENTKKFATYLFYGYFPQELLDLQTKELSKEKLKGYGLPLATTASPRNKQSPGRFTGQFGAGVHEEAMTHTGIYKQKEAPNNIFPFGGVTSGSNAQIAKFSQELGNSSHDGGFGFDARGACFLGSSVLHTDQSCGVNSSSEDDLPDLQAPGSDETEPELLFDVPPNMMSFQDTALLSQPFWPKTKEEIDPHQVENGSLIMSNIWQMDSNQSDLFWNQTCAALGHALPNGTVLNPGGMLI